MYFPTKIPSLTGDFITRLPQMEAADIAYNVLSVFAGDDLQAEELQDICREVFSFPLPVKQLADKLHVLELFHGPSLSFKDVGTRFLAGLLKLYVHKYNRRFTVLVATSGDTGSAVAAALHNMPGIQVVLLYPKGKVSQIQEKTLSTFDGNVHALEIEGTFDDCQRLVKSAFNDEELREKLALTSANSINIARFLPQSIYYFKAWADLQPAPHKRLCMAVPSGNYGNLTGGLIAARMGLPVHFFVAGSNSNKVVPDYLESGTYTPRTSVRTLSNAMDVGAPSNFIRIREMFGDDHAQIKKYIKGFTATDDQTLQTMQEAYNDTGYILDPHGAIGYAACRHHMQGADQGIFLETAHPAKFSDTVEQAIGQEVPIPERLRHMIEGPKRAISFPADFAEFKNWLLQAGNIR